MPEGSYTQCQSIGIAILMYINGYNLYLAMSNLVDIVIHVSYIMYVYSCAFVTGHLVLSRSYVED